MFGRNACLLGVGLLIVVVLLGGCGGSGDTAEPTIGTLEVAATVAATIPGTDGTDVAINRKITATFSRVMDPTTVTSATFIVKSDTAPIAGTVSYLGKTATFTPASNLAPNARFTTIISRGVKSAGGRNLAEAYVWSFTTGTREDANPLLIGSTLPSNGATNVAVSNPISVTFTEPADPNTVNATTFTLKQGTMTLPVAGGVTYSDRTATFVPNKNLPANFLYTATITTGVLDLAGNPLEKEFTWRFTTGVKPAFLRSATSFAVLAGSTITNTALLTTINGDVGLSPGTAIDGFPPGVVNGVIHAGDPVAAQAKLDLTAAYNDAARRPRGPVTVAGNLGGMTLYPGIYKSTSSLEISSGDLTLDARGDEDAVFVFEMASTLTTTSGRQIFLSGGAKADNVFWQVGSSATLGSTSVFKGNLLANISITAKTGATVDGRLLTRTGAVTLDGNTINRP
jgi:hypothetical protein